MRADIETLSPAQFLSQLEERYHHRRLLVSDPLEIVHQYRDPWDQEVVALIGALLAYGNVKTIRNSVKDLLARLGQAPSDFVRGLNHRQNKISAQKKLRSFVHRFNVGNDLFFLLELLHECWEEHGSLGARFLRDLEPKSRNIEGALNSLVEEWKEKAKLRGPAQSFYYLLTAPSDGSCCKRWCMLLRWTGRKDEIDLGLWRRSNELSSTFPKHRELLPSQLIIPLDVHTGRMSQKLGFTTRKSLNWKAALEVTEALKKWDANDPTRFDFSLSRPGILKEIRET